MRADLLGLPKPDKDSIPPRPVREDVDEDEIEVDMAEGDQAKVAAEVRGGYRKQFVWCAKGLICGVQT